MSDFRDVPFSSSASAERGLKAGVAGSALAGSLGSAGTAVFGALAGGGLDSLFRLYANSRASRIPNHGYVIYNKTTGKVTANDKSYRALAQISYWKLNGFYAPGTLTTDTLANFSTRAQALDWEYDTVDFFTRLSGGIRLPRQWRPTP